MSTPKAQSLLSIEWVGPSSTDGVVKMLDQRYLPLKVGYINCTSVEQVHEAIYNMTIRGAPAIGAAGAYGMALGAFHLEHQLRQSNPSPSVEEFLTGVRAIKTKLDSARPTAVNLEWATSRIVELLSTFSDRLTPIQLANLALLEAKSLAEQDIQINRQLGGYGAEIVPQGANIIHHCNTGSLATVGHGTALGVIYSSHEQGKNIHVWVDETRPRLQGAKLTAFELQSAEIPFHLVPDSASAHLMYENKVDLVVFGADRVAANGDVANKIGTCNLAIVAHEHKVPVYACVPTPTIDLTIESGRQIEIEQRHSSEVTHVGSEQIAPNDCPVYNPAFDVTPAKYLTGIITEEGICYPPFETSLREAKEKAERRVRDEWSQKVDHYNKELATLQSIQ